MSRNKLMAGVFLLFTIPSFLFGCTHKVKNKVLSEKLKEKIEVLQDDIQLMDSVHIYNPDIIAQLYQLSGKLMSAKWSNRKNIDQLLEFIRQVDQEGLNPEDYHLTLIENLTSKIVTEKKATLEEIADFELILTDAFLTLSSHLAGGKLDAETIDPQWKAIRRNLDVQWEVFIDSTLRYNKVKETLDRLTPNHQEYNNLVKALLKYKTIEAQGGWDVFTTSLKKIEPGTEHPDIVKLRARLSVTQGVIEPDSTNENRYDQTLFDQVVIFQVRNGLKGDGVIGKQTIEALNVPVGDRIASIEANLERWRWLSDDLGERYIMVNIANFDLQLIDNGKQVFATEAIVGRPYRMTPVFSSLMTYLVLNPDWTVPPTILKNDVIPEVIKNSNYLIEKGMKVLTMDGKEVNASAIDWNRAAKSGFPYMIRQEPGKLNALGKVKFMFPNQHNVYIHDTPSRNLFTQTDRGFSSGCIRVNRPIELAALLLADLPVWTPQQIDQVLNQGKPRTVNLPKPIPVHLLYMTAWADGDGTVYFRKDIYNRDQPLLLALKQQYEHNTDEL